MKSLFKAIKKIAPCECHFLKDDDSLKKVTSADGAVGIAFIDNNITEFILKLRISPELRGTTGRLPIIFLGFRSLRSLLRTERLPKLLSSHGIYYLKLPADVAEVNKVLNTAKLMKIENPVEAVRSFIETSDDISKEQSKIVHTMGNFFGSEKLLYGAYLEQRISANKLKGIIKATRSIQRDYCKEDLFNYDLHVISQPDYETKPDITTLNSPAPEVKILFIDDLAHLGWAQAVAQVLSGEQEINITSDTSGQGLIIHMHSSQDRKIYLESLSKDPSKEISETTFFNKLLNKLDDLYVNNFDIVLLDLRLKKSVDENLIDPTVASGTEILGKLREINSGIPIIVLTASRMAKNMDRVYNLGADDYMIKEILVNSDEDAKDYFSRFADIVSQNMNKSCLADVWNIIKHLEGSMSQEILMYLKKTIAFLRKRPLQFEKEALGFDLIGEAVLTLNKIWEESRTSITNSFDGGFLLRGLRHQVAHKAGISYDQDDAKIAVYLAVRLLTEEESVLKPFVDKAFSGIKVIAASELLRRSHAMLANLLLMSHIEALNLDAKRLRTGEEGDIFDSLKDKKDNHYLLFICSLKKGSDAVKHYEDYQKADKTVLSYIFNKFSSMTEISSRYSGITMKSYDHNTGLIKTSEGSWRILFIYKDINDKTTRKMLKQNTNTSVDFDLTVNSYGELIARNISIKQ